MQINFHNLTYYFKSEDSIPIYFIGFKVPFHQNTSDVNTKLAKSEEDQKQIKSSLNDIARENPKDSSNTIKNIKNLYKSGEKAIKLYNDYARIKSEANYKAKYGEGLKILTPKQMLQKLPIALAHIKVSNNSEKLLNEISQINYSLYQ